MAQKRRSLRDRNAAAIAAENDVPEVQSHPQPVPAVSEPEPEPTTLAVRPPAAPVSDSSVNVGEMPTQPPVTPPEPRRRGRPISSSTPGGHLVLWVPKDLRTRMQRYRTDEGKIYLTQVLDALEQTIDDLPALIAEETAPAIVKGSLFERRESPSVPETSRVQLTIPGVLKSQLEVIDRLVTETGAGSRSKLVNTALAAHLPR